MKLTQLDDHNISWEGTVVVKTKVCSCPSDSTRAVSMAVL